jgi:hypothetical protein
MIFDKGCVRHNCKDAKLSGEDNEKSSAHINKGIPKKSKMPESRWRIETIAVMGKRRVNKFKLMGLAFLDCDASTDIDIVSFERV